ncbi:MAG: metal-sulfur cluster assembly factor [Thermoanaerobaculia bacterium]|nr:metal-sulfur cluster assembly factor [Thermoanaerobaculia bacterium]
MKIDLPPPATFTAMRKEKDNIADILRAVVDPELMVNIIDLGLVYDIRCDDPFTRIDIDMTLTSPGCPLGDVIVEDMEYRLFVHYPDTAVNIRLVWDPPWTPERLTAAGKAALGRA